MKCPSCGKSNEFRIEHNKNYLNFLLFRCLFCQHKFTPHHSTIVNMLDCYFSILKKSGELTNLLDKVQK